ncbi:MAG: hypothetical protein ACLR7O_10855, partial [Ruminococcus callidus]
TKNLTTHLSHNLCAVLPKIFWEPIYDIFTKGLDFFTECVYNKTYHLVRSRAWRHAAGEYHFR